MNIEEFFLKYPKTAIAYSGGVDSSYLLYAAKKYGKDVKAYYVRTSFQPEFEYEDAKKTAEYIGVNMATIEIDILSDDRIRDNPKERCYYCKQKIMGTIKKEAENDGYSLVIEGTNASDNIGDRPGMKAIKELGILSPLLECSMTKNNIRELSKKAGLQTWNKPSYSCLATRIPTGDSITESKLNIVEDSENKLRNIGFSDFRVRLRDGGAVMELREEDIERAFRNRDKILETLSRELKFVSVDLNPRI